MPRQYRAASPCRQQLAAAETQHPHVSPGAGRLALYTRPRGLASIFDRDQVLLSSKLHHLGASQLCRHANARPELHASMHFSPRATAADRDSNSHVSHRRAPAEPPTASIARKLPGSRNPPESPRPLPPLATPRKPTRPRNVPEQQSEANSTLCISVKNCDQSFAMRSVITAPASIGIRNSPKPRGLPHRPAASRAHLAAEQAARPWIARSERRKVTRLGSINDIARGITKDEIRMTIQCRNQNDECQFCSPWVSDPVGRSDRRSPARAQRFFCTHAFSTRHAVQTTARSKIHVERPTVV